MSLLAAWLVLTSAAPIEVLVLPLEPVEKSDSALAAEMTGLVREVAGSMDGLLGIEPGELEAPLRAEYRAILDRCGSEPDCRLKIGTLLGARAIVFGTAAGLDGGLRLSLQAVDVGSGHRLGKITRTLSGSRINRAATVETLLTGLLFPERLVGSLDIFLDQPGADVYVDGRKRAANCAAQLHLTDLRAGQHTVRIEQQGWADYIAIVQVPFTGTARLEVRRRPVEQPAPAGAGEMVAAGSEDRWYEHWWIWAAIGIVVAGATASTVILTK